MSDKKRSAYSSTSRVKKLKKVHFSENDVFDSDSSEEPEKTPRRLIPSSQPILKNELKKKLHLLLANWKPPLKKAVANSQNCNETEGGKSIPEKDNNSQINLQGMSQENSGNEYLKKNAHYSEIVTDDCSSKPNNGVTENANEMQLIIEKETTILDDTSVLNFSSTSDGKTSETVDFKNGKSKESIFDLKDEVANSKAHDTQNIESIENFVETNHMLSSETSTEESSKSLTLKVEMPIENTKFGEVSPERTNNSQCRKDPGQTCSKQSELSIDEELSRDQPDQKDVKTDTGSSCNVEMPCNTAREIEEKEIDTRIQDSITNPTNLIHELDDDLNISHSQLESIENTIMPTPLQSRIAHTTTSTHFSPFSSTFTPTMPQMNWIHQAQEDRKTLQAVTREISQLNAMLTRAIREIWSVKKPS